MPPPPALAEDWATWRTPAELQHEPDRYQAQVELENVCFSAVWEHGTSRAKTVADEIRRKGFTDTARALGYAVVGVFATLMTTIPLHVIGAIVARCVHVQDNA